ncbi:hypothetical protein HK098_003289 [Nowakowskiella sp. JEL0407]|nr:hypothetical protein HK098_003289 [Nowakowskiella sp. JEL0407]
MPPSVHFNQLNFKYLETIKQNATIADAVNLYTSGLDQYTQFYALNLLEHSIKSVQKSELDILVDLLKFPAEKLVQNKLMSVLSTSALMMGMEEWLKLDECLRLVFAEVKFEILLYQITDFLPLTQKSEQCLILLKTLCEDIYFYETYSPVPRKQLKSYFSGLVLSSELLVEQIEKQKNIGGEVDIFWIRCLERRDGRGWLKATEEWVDYSISDMEHANGVGGIERGQNAERGAVLGLEFLALIFDWVIPRAIYTTSVLTRLLTLISSPSELIRLGACDCLLVLYSRNFPAIADRKVIIWSATFTPAAFDTFQQAFLNPTLPPSISHSSLESSSMSTLNLISNARPYEIQKRLAQIICAIGETQIPTKEELLPRNFRNYLDLLNLVSNHPSLVISGSSISVWIELLKLDYIKRSPELISFMPNLVSFIPSRLIKPEQVSNDPVKSSYADVDFDSNFEVEKYCLVQRQKSVILLGMITRLIPLESFEFIANRICGQLQNPNAEELAISGILLEAIAGQLNDLKLADEQKGVLFNEVLTLFKILLEFKSQDPAILKQILPMYVMLIEQVSRDNIILRQTLEKVWSLVLYHQDGVPYPEIRNVRAKAATTLPFYDGFATRIAEAIPSLSWGLRNHLYEFLLSIVYFSTTPDVDVKKRLFLGIVVPLVEEWNECAMPDSAEGMRNLLGIMELNQYAINAAQDPTSPTCQLLVAQITEKDAIRGKIHSCIQAIWSCMRLTITNKRKKQSGTDYQIFWQPLLELIMPNLVKCIRAIHGTWHLPSWNLLNLPPKFNDILNISIGERAYVLGRQGTIVEDLEPGEMAVDKQIRSLSSWLAHIREQSYQTLGLLPYLPYYYTLLTPSLISSIFHEAEYIDNRHWKSMIQSFVKPMVLCAADNSDRLQVLQGCLQSLFLFVGNKLETEWSKIVESGNFNMGDEMMEETADEQVSDEILAERILRDLTDTYSEFLSVIFAFEPKNMQQEKGLFKNPKLVQFLLSTSTLSQPLLRNLCSLVTFKHTTSSRRILAVLSGILPVLTENPEFYNVIGYDMVMCALRTLNDGYQKEIYTELISLVCDIYVFMGSKSAIVRETFKREMGMDEMFLKEFERQLSQTTQQKEKQMLFRQFLKNIMGVSVSEIGKLGKDNGGFVLNKSEKLVFLSSDVKSGNDVGDLGTLFGEEE